MLGRQPIVITQLLTCLNVPERHNPDGALGHDGFAVRLTRMVNVARGILQRLAIDIVAVVERKNIGIPLGESLGTCCFGNFLTDVFFSFR